MKAMLLALLTCNGVTDPDWRPLALEMVVSGFPYEESALDLCFETENWDVNGLQVTRVCGPFRPKSPYETDWVEVWVQNNRSDTVAWLERNVGETRTEVRSHPNLGVRLVCYPLG